MEELPYQVTLITGIYSQAEVVTIWLGKDIGAKGAERGVHIINSIAEFAKKDSGKEMPRWKDVSSRLDSEEKTKRLKKWKSRSDGWGFVYAAFGIGWFTRVWILQEFAQSKRNALGSKLAATKSPPTIYSSARCTC
jgi:Heterokaryon incompatibility protein (HET)